MAQKTVPAPRENMLPIDDGGGTGPTEIPPSITLAAIAAVHGAQPGVGVTVSGTWFEGDGFPPYDAYVTAGGLQFPIDLAPTNKWSATVRFYQAGTFAVTAHLSDSSDYNVSSKAQNVSVTLDSATVDAAIVQPGNGSTIQVGEGGTAVALVASTSPDYGPRRVTWTATCGGTTLSGGTDISTADPRLRSSTISLPALPLGSWTVTARSTALDPSGAEVNPALAKTASVTVSAVDASPPHLDVKQPTDERTFVVATPTMDVPVALAASDAQSHVKTVTVSVDGGQPTTLLTGDGSYTGTVRVTGYGVHNLTFTAVDAAARAAGDRTGTTVVTKAVTLRSNYVPASLGERLDNRAYLAALLDFARSHVVLRADATPPPHASVTDLEQLTFLRLGDLSQPASAAAAVGGVPVSRLQLAVETLRRYLGPDLVAGRWSFAGAAGATTAADLSGHGQTLTLSGNAALGTDSGGRPALVMRDGTGTASGPVSAGPRVGDNGSDYTVAFWLTVATTPNGSWRAVVRRGSNDGERTFAVWLRPDDNGLHIRVSTTANTNEGINATTPLALNRPTHVTITKAGNLLTVYLDGRYDTSAQLSAPSVGNNGPTWVGSSLGSTSFTGSIAALEVLGEAVPDTVAPLLGSAVWPAPGTAAAALRAYGDSAYEALLGAFGSSSAELRLSRGAPNDQRAELAGRFGIRLSSASSDELNQLVLPTGGRTEAALETLFGLPSTDPALPAPHAVPVSALSRWRELALSRRWSEQDQALDPQVASFGVLVDPDVITKADLTPAGAAGPPGSLLAARAAEVASITADLRAARLTGTTQPAMLTAVVAKALPGVDLAALETAQAGGQDIAAALAAANLTAPGFAMLRTAARLASAGAVRDEEWTDVEALLTRVVTLSRRTAWRAAETAVTLAPASFVDSGPGPSPVPWRTDLPARAAWLRRLRSRMADLEASRAELGAAVSAAQAAALPALRDSLLAGVEGADAAAGVARWLDTRLGTDVLVGAGSPATTRVESATEVVQSVLGALRGGRIPAWHPARAWKVDDERRFDIGWTWLSDQAGWVAAMLTWLYPENVLAPELTPAPSSSFAALVADLRGGSPGVESTRARANTFLGPLRSAVEAGMRAPRARWQLAEGTGTTAGDSSGAGLSLPLTAPGWTQDGLFGPALSFDGAGPGVTLPDAVNAALKNVVNDFTLSFWAFPTAPHEIDQQATSGVTGTSGQRYALGPMQAGDRYADNGAAGAGVSVGTNGITVYEHGNGHMPAVLVYVAPVVGWTHVTVVYAARVPSLYVNGALVATAANASPKATIYAAPDQIGNTRSGVLNGGARAEYGAFQGLLADVRVDAGALNATEILQSSFMLTEQRSTADIQRLQQLATALLGRFAAPRTDPAAAPLREAFYLAPVLVAQTLARAGEFAAALDWFQTVYALDLPPGRRAVYPVLAGEANTSVDLSPVGDWLTQLNPHVVAATRPNPYTRFTLAAVAQCLMDYGDSEFARGLDTSLASARALYDAAAEVLADPSLAYVAPPAGAAETTFPNPALEAQRTAIAVRLAKLRQGRDLAGVPRISSSPDSATTLAAGPAAGQPQGPVAPRPTPYRYKVLLERARQLVGLASQIEQEYLSAMEKYDAAQFRVFDAQKAVDVTLQQVQLQQLRITEADDGVTAAGDQKARADWLASAYSARITAGLNGYERAMLQDYSEIRTLKNIITGLDTAIGVAQAASSGSSLLDIVFSGGSKLALAGIQAAAIAAKGITTGVLNNADARLAADQLMASHENQVADWRIQLGLAQRDAVAASDAIKTATDNRAVVGQEKAIADLQAQQASATLTFLDRQFTNAELYAWMTGVLGGVYRYFLQLAATTAALAQQQLAFERQDVVPAIVARDYWQSLPAPASNAAGQYGGAAPSTSPDRRGLTGAERLLQDVTRLDEYAFETDKRRLNLTQSFSLADRLPLEFYEFRGTGRLSFATPMTWFDECFPGHVLRLVKRVRVSVVGLIPPATGVRATLTGSGISRVVLPSSGYPAATLVRSPESVALTSPVSASGVFDLDAQADLLLPFEGSGVDTTWTLDLPQPANPFDFRSLADVVVTFEYTAVDDADYRDTVLRRLQQNGRVSGDRLTSLRADFVDQYYELCNPDDRTAARTVTLPLAATDFPDRLSDLQVEQVAVVLVAAEGHAMPALPVGMQHGGAGGTATTIDGVVSTRRGNGAAWASIAGSPLGDWTLTLDPAAGALLDSGALVDVLLDVGYSGVGPAWPR